MKQFWDFTQRILSVSNWSFGERGGGGEGKGREGKCVCVCEIQMTYWVTGTGWKGDILL